MSNCIGANALFVAASLTCLYDCHTVLADDVSSGTSNAPYNTDRRDELLTAALAGSKHDIEQRRYDSDASVALIAYWHTLDYSRAGEVREFIGHLSRSLLCPVPPSWKRALVTAATTRSGGNADRYSEATKDILGDDTREIIANLTNSLALGNGLRFKFSRVAQCTQTDGTLRLKQGGTHVGVTLEWLTMQRFNDRLLLKNVNNGRNALVIATNEHATAYRMAMYDIGSGKREWTGDIWALGLPKVIKNGGNHELAIIETDHALVFFGANGDCYVESFDKNTGRCLTRFATNDWKDD